MMKPIQLILIVACTLMMQLRLEAANDNNLKSMDSDRAFVLSTTPICITVDEQCQPVLHNAYPQNKREPLLLTVGKLVRILESNGNSRSGRWHRIDTTYCLTSNCSEGTVKGWVNAIKIARESAFVKIREWKGPMSIDIYVADFDGHLEMSVDGSFTYEGGGNAEGVENTRRSNKGHMYRYKNILLAKLDGAAPLVFVEQQVDSKRLYCWTQRDDDESCFEALLP